MTSEPNTRAVIVKLGGSLITDRSQYRVTNDSAILAYCDCIVHFWTTLRQMGVVIVLGGGSFGHNVVQTYELLTPESSKANRVILPISLGELRSVFARALQERGIPCLPFCLSSMCVADSGIIARSNLAPVSEALRQGFLPILSGGMVLDHSGIVTIVSSDEVAGVLLGTFGLERAVVLTDVPGVLDHRSRVVERVTQENYKQVRQCISRTRKVDANGGMIGKYDSLISLARQGVRAVIMDGRDPMAALQRITNSDFSNGTQFELFSSD